ncbi:uncharacterized protein LOC109542950 isoform X3 [Dendroctonus ponderosae]|uniref:uncharacterized protein LOC109542950 isoform X3 n=1 Tax=Dendroctonus ponderosae TaxID=77166 RepID=UPI002036426D|nr:uncharacterized protein LOC109542950 isoform X3 [Dendroctonus ponderosae]
MYKLICANIAKSRNFTHSYKKVALANRIHLDASRPQSAPPSTSLEENAEELNDEENGAPISSGARNQKPSKANRGSASKPHPTLSHLVKPQPPAAATSRRSFHLNAISSPSRRTCFTQGPRNSIEEEVKESYRRAMNQLYSMQQDKPEFQFKEQAVHPLATSTKRRLSLQQAKHQKKVAGRTGITYPTHTYKHNLTFSRRYRLREESAERKVRELEEEFTKRMKMQRKMFKTITAKTITYPNLVENLKKSRPLVEERQPPQPERPTIKVVQPPQQQTRDGSDASIKSHPIIGAASKEAKMKLKSKFVQLLLRSTRSCTQPQETSMQESDEPAQLPDDTEAGGVLDDFSIKDPKRVWMDHISTSPLSLEDVCLREGKSSGTELVGNPNASQMEEEATEGPRHELKTKQTATDLTKGDTSLGNLTRGDLRPKMTRNRARPAVGKRAPEAARASLYHTERKAGTSRGEDPKPTGASDVLEQEHPAPKADNLLGAEPEMPPNVAPKPQSDDVQNIKPSTDPNAVETRYEDLYLLVRAQKCLDPPTEVEELNEHARDKDAACTKQRQKEAEHHRVEDLKNQAQSLPSLKTPNVVPRIDKINDRLQERSQLAENAKNAIQSLTSVPRPAVEPPKKRLLLFKRAPERKSRLDSQSKCDKLNQAAREWAQKHRKRPAPHSYTLEQSSAKAPKPEKLKTRESDLKEGQFQKTQQELEEFYRKKSQEWNQMPGEKSEWAALRAKRILKGPIEVIEVLAPTTFIKEENVILFAPSYRGKLAKEEQKPELKPDKSETEDTKEDTEKEQFPKHGAANEGGTEGQGIESSAASDGSNLKPQEGQKNESEANPQTSTQEISYQTADVSKDYQEHILKQFFNAKLLSGGQQSVYMPKERLIINNIKEQEDDCKSDGAVLRPGDEIVFVGNSGPSANELSAILPNRLEKALVTSESLGCQLAVAESRALMDTRTQIDDMMKKISQLEIMVQQQQQSLAKEDQLANKIRAPPPKRPEGTGDRTKAQAPSALNVADKDKKQERPKGPHDVVLPPKGGSWKPEDGPARQKSQDNCGRPSELSAVVARPKRCKELEEPAEKRGQTEATVLLDSAQKPAKKIIKTPKSQSLAKAEEQQAAGKPKLEANKSTYEGLQLNSLSAGRKTGTRRPASCSPVGPRVKKSDQPASKAGKSHLETGRTKFSSWSTCKFHPPAKNAPEGPHQGEPKSIKRAASDAAAGSKASRPAPKESSKTYLGPDYAISKIVKRLPLKTVKGAELEGKLPGNPPFQAPSKPVPKVLKAPVKKPRSVVELYTQRIQERTKRKPHEDNHNEALELSEDSKKAEDVADFRQDPCGCVADSNLKQAEPIGTLTVILPQKSCSRSPQGRTLNATGYKSERTFSSGKSTIRKAPISTSSGPKFSDATKKPPKKEKTALFRIQSDGEVFIVKKADDSSSGKPANAPPTYDYMDRVKNQVEVHEAADEDQSGPRLKAEIRTIYNKDQSRTISESSKHPARRPENRAQAWRPLFGDLSAPDFQQIRDEFFQHPPKEKFIKPQSISTDGLVKKPVNPPESQPSTPEKPSGGCDSMLLNKRYSQMLRNIEKRLAEKRKNATKPKSAERPEAAPPTDGLYTLKAPQQKIPLTERIRDTLYQLRQPLRAHSFDSAEATLAQKKRILYESILKVKTSTPKLIADDRLNREVETWSRSLRENVENRKSLTGGGLEAAGPQSRAPPPKPAPKSRSSCSSFTQVKKLISEDNLAGEVEAWGLSLLHSMEKQKPASPISVQQPRPPDSQANERFCKPDTKVQFKAAREQPKREPGKYPLPHEERFMCVEKSMRNKLTKEAQRTKPVAAARPKRADSPKPVNQVDINQLRKTFTVASRTEMEKRRKKLELQEAVFNGKKELNAQQQEQRSKKDKVGQMNSAALDLLRKKSVQDEQEMSRGTRRQNMYGNGAKAVKPSVGNGPWGHKIRPSSVDKKRFHSGTNINGTSNKEVLMSRAEFLRLRKAASERKVLEPPNHTVEAKKEAIPGEMSQAKVTTEDEKQEEHAQQAADLDQNAKAELLNGASDLKTQAKNQFELLFPAVEPKAGVENLGAEIEKFFDARPSGAPVSSQQGRKSELGAASETQRGAPGPQLTTDGLHYKIAQMAKAIVDDLRVQDSLKSLTDPAELEVTAKSHDQGAEGIASHEVVGEFSKCDNKCGAIIKCVVHREETPNAADSPDTREEDAVKSAVDKMVELKRKNKASRRLKSTSLQNMVLQPEADSDKEEPAIVKGANFIFKQPKPRESPKSPCQQLVLPMKKPTFQGGGLSEHQSTLDQPLGDAIRSVPKETKTQKPADALRRARADPLARYRHLRITYVTIKRPNREADKETFLPAATASPTDDKDEGERNRILNYRFQLLKRLNEDFHKQQQDRLLPPVSSQETTVGGDSAWDVKSYLEEEMKATRTIFKETTSRSASTSKTLDKKAGVLPPKNSDDKKPGGRRSFSTDSQKGPDETGIEICQSQLTLPETDAEPPESCAQGFDVLEAVPEAFECPSPQLEEHRQQNLYYRYHKWSFTDLHNYLQQHRVDATTQSGKQ